MRAIFTLKKACECPVRFFMPSLKTLNSEESDVCSVEEIPGKMRFTCAAANSQFCLDSRESVHSRFSLESIEDSLISYQGKVQRAVVQRITACAISFTMNKYFFYAGVQVLFFKVINVSRRLVCVN